MEWEKIELAGFRDIDEPSIELVNKIISHHFRRFQEHAKAMQGVHITLKTIHQREKSEKYEIHAKLIDTGKVYVSKVTDRNLLAAIDKALDKIVNEMD